MAKKPQVKEADPEVTKTAYEALSGEELPPGSYGPVSAEMLRLKVLNYRGWLPEDWTPPPPP